MCVQYIYGIIVFLMCWQVTDAINTWILRNRLKIKSITNVIYMINYVKPLLLSDLIAIFAN